MQSTLVRNEFAFGYRKYNKQDFWVKGIANFPTIARYAFREIFSSSPQLISNISGMDTIEFRNRMDSGYILSSMYSSRLDQDIIRLVSLNGNQVSMEWKPDMKYFKKNKSANYIFSNSELMTAKSIRLMNPYCLNNGDVIFLTSNGVIALVNKKSEIVWKIDGTFNHSIEIDDIGNIWVPSLSEQSLFNRNKYGKVKDGAVMQISLSGKVLFKKSISEILIQNGYTALLMGTGGIEEDPIHLNEIRPALYDSRYWKKGDLLISIRNKSTLFLYRPSTNKILWLQTGPWLNQHCPDFVDSSRISVFGNDMVRTYQGDSLLNGYNNIYIYNFADHSISTPYTEAMKKAQVKTVSEGRAKVLPNGDVFIEESNYGRMLRLSKTDIIWQYVNKVDENHVSIGNWSRYLLKNEDCKFCFTEDFYNGQVH